MLSTHILVSLVVTLCVVLSTDGFLKVCYYQSWMQYKWGMARFTTDNIEPSLCTHLVYAFGKINRASKVIEAADPNVEEGYAEDYWQFNVKQKQRNSKLKTLLSIGGQNDHSDGFIAISETDQILQNFVTTTITFLRERKFDGLDVDWEFPDAARKPIFTKLLKALREGFDKESSDPDRRLLLTIAVAAGQWYIDPGYDVPEVVKYIDYASVMTYDFTGKEAAITAFNSPLYARSDPKFDSRLNTNWTVHYWNQKGLPFNKTVVGFTGVGRRLVLQDKNTTELVGAATTKEVRTTQYYDIPNGMAYPEICVWLKEDGVQSYFDEEQKNPYLVKDDNWVGYEDERSIEIKMQWMTELGVAGIMLWALDQDDFSGKYCDNGPYPLLNAVKRNEPTTTKSTTTTTTTTTTTATTATTTTTTARPSVSTTESEVKTDMPTTRKSETTTEETEKNTKGPGDAAHSLHAYSVVVALLVASFSICLSKVSGL